jgi:hypothetical protein
MITGKERKIAILARAAEQQEEIQGNKRQVCTRIRQGGKAERTGELRMVDDCKVRNPRYCSRPRSVHSG